MLIRDISIYALLILMSSCANHKTQQESSDDHQDSTDYYEYEYESNSVTTPLESDSGIFIIHPTTNYVAVFHSIDSIASHNPYWSRLRPDESYPKEDLIRARIEGLSYFTNNPDFWQKACTWLIRQYMKQQKITLPQEPILATMHYETLLDTFLIALKGKDDMVNLAYYHNAEFLITKYKSFFYRDMLKEQITNEKLETMLDEEFDLWNKWFEAKKKEIDVVAGLEVATYFGWQESMDRVAFLKQMQEHYIYCARNLYCSLKDARYVPNRYYPKAIISRDRLNKEFDYSIKNIKMIRFEAQGDEKRVITDKECADVFRYQKHIWNKWMDLRKEIQDLLQGHVKEIYFYNTNYLERAQLVALKNEEVYIGVCSQSVMDALYHMESTDKRLLASERIHDILEYD